MNKKIKVFFRVDAGVEDGLGHMKRCLILANSFTRSELFYKPEFITYSPDLIGVGILTSENYSYLSSQDCVASEQDAKYVISILNKYTYPVFIVDSKFATNQYVEEMKYNAFVICLDDEKYRTFTPDILINNNIWIKLSMYEQKSTDVQYFLGSEFNLLNPILFRNRDNFSDKLKHKKILITLGGEDPDNFTLSILKTLKKQLMNYELTVILGAAHTQSVSVLNYMRAELPHAELVVNAKDMSKHIDDSTFVITAGGVTCYELAAAGRPQFSVLLDRHQEKMVSEMENRGVLKQLTSKYNYQDEEIVQKFVNYITDDVMLKQMHTASKYMFKKSGAEIIVSKLYEEYSNRRHDGN